MGGQALSPAGVQGGGDGGEGGQAEWHVDYALPENLNFQEKKLRMKNVIRNSFKIGKKKSSRFNNLKKDDMKMTYL